MKTEFMPNAPKNWKELEPHPLAALVTFGVGIDLQKLAAHMRQHGYDSDEPIIIFDGKILDGRHRHLAAQEADVAPTFKRFIASEHEARAHVVKKCLRQHLSVSQLGLLAGKLANLPNGMRPPPSSNDDGSPNTLEAAAAEVGVSKKTAERGKKVAEQGTDKLQEAVANETISLSDAAAVADEPAKVQDAAVKDVSNGKAPTARAAVRKRKDENQDADTPKSTDTPKDGNGVLYPAVALPAISQASRLAQLERYLRDGIELAEQIAAEPIGLYLDPAGIRARLTEAKSLVLASHPKYVCKNCGGEDKKCKWCKGQGWQTSGGYRQCPEPTK